MNIFITLLIILNLLVLFVILAGWLAERWDWWKTPRQWQFLLLPLPFPPVDEKVIAQLLSLRDEVLLASSAETKEIVSAYVKAIDVVLSRRDRESLLRLHAIRIVLRRRIWHEMG